MTLHDYLTKRRLCEREFAEMIGTSQQQVNRWRRGRIMPSPEWVLAIEKATRGWVKPGDWYERFRASA